MSTAACAAPTRSALGRTVIIWLKATLPATPPTAEPTAMGIKDRESIDDDRVHAFWTSVDSDMTSTETLDRKLTAPTPITPIASTTGLMITPPPIPHRGPSSEARKQTMNTATKRTSTTHLSNMYEHFEQKRTVV